MSNGIVNFEIQLDDPTETYTPGEILSGKLIVDLNRKKNLRALKLRFKGECKVLWVEKRGSERKSRHYKGVETYFRNDVCVFGNIDGESTSMEPGHHVVPFSFNLPREIPSSFRHPIANVCYSIKAIMDRPWKYDHKVSKIITIESSDEWDPPIHHGEVGFDDNIEETFRNCLLPCINLGNMSLRFRVPTTVFLCGDSIEATVNINNSSHVDVERITMQLKQKLSFHAQSSSKVKHEVTEVQSAVKMGPFSANAEVKIGFQVPALPCTSFKYCKLIGINYYLRIEVHPVGCHASSRRAYDVVIGRGPSIVPQQDSYSSPTSHSLAPSAPQLMPDQTSSSTDSMQHKTVHYNFPSENGHSANSIPQVPLPFPSNNLPYPPAMFPGTGDFPYPPESIRQPPGIGFISPSSTSSRDGNPNEPPPPSYDSIMAGSGKSSHK